MAHVAFKYGMTLSRFEKHTAAEKAYMIAYVRATGKMEAWEMQMAKNKAESLNNA